MSNTSSSATGKMAHQKRTDKHYQSCRVTFDPFTPYLYKQTKRRKMAHQKRTDKDYQSCRVTFDPFTPYLYKQTKRRKMAHQKRTDKHYQSCRVTFHPFTPYLYKQTKRRQNKSNGKIAWVETVLSLDLGPDESGRGTELPRGRKENFIPSPLLVFSFSFPKILQSHATHPVFLISNFLLNSSSWFQCTLFQSDLLGSYIESFCCLL